MNKKTITDIDVNGKKESATNVRHFYILVLIVVQECNLEKEKALMYLSHVLNVIKLLDIILKLTEEVN